ncbi:tetratricopeptide repeat protein [Thiotrichales bacterium 19S11-10]|nr:tetratricopeptide repeat protein [Thiotrichales bacterium 19S11-10]
MVNMTEDDNRQLQLIKQLWKRFGNIILWALIVVVAIYAVYAYWQKHEENKRIEASQSYMQLQNTIQSGLQSKVIIQEANQLMQNYPSSVYAQFAAFLLAKEYVEKGNYQAAETSLNWVLSHSEQPPVKAEATLRLARVQIANNKAQDAVSLIDNAKLPESYQVLGELVKAKAYIYLKEKKNAENSFNQALTLLRTQLQMNDPLNDELIKQNEDYIEMQLSNLNLLIDNASSKEQKGV